MFVRSNRSEGRPQRSLSLLVLAALLTSFTLMSAPDVSAQGPVPVEGTVFAGTEPLADVGVISVVQEVTTDATGAFVVETLPVVEDEWFVGSLQTETVPRFIFETTVDSTVSPIDITLPEISQVEIIVTGGRYEFCADGPIDPRCLLDDWCTFERATAGGCDEASIELFSPTAITNPPTPVDLDWSWIGTTTDNLATLPAFAGTTATIIYATPEGRRQRLVNWDLSSPLELELDRAWYIDSDGDGFGDPNNGGFLAPVSPGDNYVSNGGDCLDFDANVSPDSPEIPENGIDENCDGEDAVSGLDIRLQVVPETGGTCPPSFEDTEAGLGELVTITGNGPALEVTYCFAVANAGPSTIENITIDHPSFSAPRSLAPLAPGEEALLSTDRVVESDEQEVSEATVNGTNTGGLPVTSARDGAQFIVPTLCFGFPITIDLNAGDSGVGTAGDDVILGTNGNDVIFGRGGDDRICARGGDDEIVSGTGNDRVDGGRGDDTIRGGSGDDELLGAAGNDVLSGGSNDDTIRGGAGDDELRGDRGEDQLRGSAGEDQLFGGPDDDDLLGGSDDDMLEGGSGDDRLRGSQGNDVLSGGFGNDILNGGADVDTCEAGSGADGLFSCEL